MANRKVLMCRPDHFDVTYDINHWMHDQIGQVDKSRAVTQWYELAFALSRVADVHMMNGVQDLPDLVFTANAGFIQGDMAVLSRFSTEERQPEEDVFAKWFLYHKYNLFRIASKYEGEGDHLRDSLGHHWMGHGFRTEKDAAKELSKLLNCHINTLEMVDPRWYHLDTCFCPLPNGEVMWAPHAFSDASKELIRKSFGTSIEVSLEDALLFCCNCVCIGDTLFMQGGSQVVDKLRALGYTVWEGEFGEFIKSGGSAKCLVLDCNFSTKE